MDKLKIDGWLQLAANVGILAGLVFVYLQLEQNNEILKAEMLRSESQASIQMEQSLIGENGAQVWAKALQNPTDLTLAEQRILEAIIWSNVENWRHSYHLATAGFIEKEWQARIDTDAPYFLGNPYGRAWWQQFGGNNNLPVELRDYISETLAQPRWPHNFPIDYHARIIATLHQAGEPTQGD